MKQDYSTNGRWPIALFNGTVVTTDGLYRVQQISDAAARDLVTSAPITSAVGHKAAADLLSDILGVEVPENRIPFVQQPGQLAIALKLNTRPPEGAILTKQEMMSVGYTLRLIERLE